MGVPHVLDKWKPSFLEGFFAGSSSIVKTLPDLMHTQDDAGLVRRGLIIENIGRNECMEVNDVAEIS